MEFTKIELDMLEDAVGKHPIQKSNKKQSYLHLRKLLMSSVAKFDLTAESYRQVAGKLTDNSRSQSLRRLFYWR